MLSIFRAFKVANVYHGENICKRNETVMYFSNSQPSHQQGPHRMLAGHPHL